jgi:hypothetical protein
MAAPNSVLSTTLQLLRDKLVDNSFTSHPLFRAMEQSGTMKKISGGARVEQPVIFGSHSSITNLSNGFEPVSLAVTDPFRRGIFEWATFTQPIVLSDVERLSNKGDLAIVNILESKVKNVMINLKTAVSERVFKGTGPITVLSTLNGTGITAGAVDTTGWLQTAAFGSQTTNTVGGLSKTTYAGDNWNNQVYNSADAFDLSHLDQIMIDCSLYHPAGTRPDIIFMSPKCFAAFQAQQQSFVQYVNQSDRDSLDKEMVAMWRGAKIYVDVRLGFVNTAGDDVSAYLLSSDMLAMYMDTDADFNVSDLIPVPGTATLMSRVLVRMQLVTGSLATLGILINAES